MKIKKFLEKVAEEDRESHIDEKDIEFLASVGVDYNKKREEDKKQPSASYYLTAPAFNYKAFLISASCFLLAAVALVLILYYSLKPSSVEPPSGYLSGKDDAPSNFQELNGDLKLFSLIVNESDYNEITVKKTYDKSSGKSLYYSIDFNGLRKSFKLEIVVNDKYEHNNPPLTGEIKETNISNYTLRYTEIFNSMPGLPLNEASCQGEIQIGNQWVYITSYTETVVGEQSTFVETISSLISIK